MRAGFLGQNICALGFGIATLQAPRLVMDHPVEGPLTPSDESTRPVDGKITESTGAVTNPQRLDA